MIFVKLFLVVLYHNYKQIHLVTEPIKVTVKIGVQSTKTGDIGIFECPAISVTSMVVMQSLGDGVKFQRTFKAT